MGRSSVALFFFLNGRAHYIWRVPGPGIESELQLWQCQIL